MPGVDRVGASSLRISCKTRERFANKRCNRSSIYLLQRSAGHHGHVKGMGRFKKAHGLFAWFGSFRFSASGIAKL
jgi:hypothetical protein